MRRKEVPGISELPTGDIQREITTRVLDFRRRGLLPNGFQQLVWASETYRPNNLFREKVAYRQERAISETELKRLRRKWLRTYDPYAGKNLADTAYFQHQRHSPDMPFPQPGTEEYSEMVQQMGELGGLVRELFGRMKPEEQKDALFKINSSTRDQI